MMSPIRVAIDQRCLSNADATEAGRVAVSIGFDGITLDGLAPAGPADFGLPVAAISTTAGFRNSRSGEDAAVQISHLVEQAAALGCEIIQLPDIAVGQTVDRSVTPLVIGDWLLTLADQAAEHGVTLAVTNGSVVRTAKMMWNLLERANHPAIACCWDVDAAMRWGELPGVSVPVLGSRIVASRMGNVAEQGKLFLIRLRGIGFGGWVTVDDPSIATADAMAVIRNVLKPKIVAKAAGKKTVAKV